MKDDDDRIESAGLKGVRQVPSCREFLLPSSTLSVVRLLVFEVKAKKGGPAIF